MKNAQETKQHKQKDGLSNQVSLHIEDNAMSFQLMSDNQPVFSVISEVVNPLSTFKPKVTKATKEKIIDLH